MTSCLVFNHHSLPFEAIFDADALREVGLNHRVSGEYGITIRRFSSSTEHLDKEFLAQAIEGAAEKHSSLR